VANAEAKTCGGGNVSLARRQTLTLLAGFESPIRSSCLCAVARFKALPGAMAYGPRCCQRGLKASAVMHQYMYCNALQTSNRLMNYENNDRNKGVEFSDMPLARFSGGT
jgi:hypothetical protein